MQNNKILKKNNITTAVSKSIELLCDRLNPLAESLQLPSDSYLQRSDSYSIGPCLTVCNSSLSAQRLFRSFQLLSDSLQFILASFCWLFLCCLKREKTAVVIMLIFCFFLQINGLLIYSKSKKAAIRFSFS